MFFLLSQCANTGVALHHTVCINRDDTVWFRNGSRSYRRPIRVARAAGGRRLYFWASLGLNRIGFRRFPRKESLVGGVTKSSKESSIVPGVSTLTRISEGCCGVFEPDLLAALDGCLLGTLHDGITEAPGLRHGTSYSQRLPDSYGRSRPSSDHRARPGVRIWCGSRAVLIASCAARVASPNRHDSSCCLTAPIPCSPITVPPNSSRVTSRIPGGSGNISTDS